jgi:hypothetical protein
VISTSSAEEKSRKGVLALLRASLCGFSIKLSRGAAQDFSSLWGISKHLREAGRMLAQR